MSDFHDEDKGACPVCGCEEQDHRGLWTCRCPAPKLPNCGACPGDGTVCPTTCRLAEESPPVP